jgi:hypothetical protein
MDGSDRGPGTDGVAATSEGGFEREERGDHIE